MKIGGLVVLYKPNNQMLENVIKISNYVDNLVIVDNSEDNIDYFENADNIIYKKMDNNVGLAKAFNVGFTFFIDNCFDWVVYFDQDTNIDDKMKKNYFDKIEYKSNVAVYTPQYEIDRKKKPILTEEFANVKWTMTSASIFNVKIFSKIGGFDERYFLDVVDYEYCLKAIKNGFLIVKYCGYSFKHCPGITKESKILKYKYGYMSPLRFYYQIRNLKLLKSEYSYWKIRLIIVMKYIKVILFFDSKSEFFKMGKKAKRDFKAKKFGKF